MAYYGSDEGSLSQWKIEAAVQVKFKDSESYLYHGGKGHVHERTTLL